MKGCPHQPQKYDYRISNVKQKKNSYDNTTVTVTVAVTHRTVRTRVPNDSQAAAVAATLPARAADRDAFLWADEALAPTTTVLCRDGRSSCLRAPRVTQRLPRTLR